MQKNPNKFIGIPLYKTGLQMNKTSVLHQIGILKLVVVNSLEVIGILKTFEENTIAENAKTDNK